MSESVIDRVAKLSLHPGGFIVAGSGILDVLNIRQANDVDVVVVQQIYDELLLDDRTWHQETSDGVCRLVNADNSVEVWSSWAAPKGRLIYEELLQNSELIDGLRFLSLDFVYTWKVWKNRPKDKNDVGLIEKYRKEQT